MADSLILKNESIMSEELQDRIDDYLMNRMSGKERECFEADLQSDSKLKEQLSFTRAVEETITSRNEKLAKIQMWQNDYVWKDGRRRAAALNGNFDRRRTVSCQTSSANINYSRTKRPGRSVLFWLSGVAAVVLSGFFLFRNFSVSTRQIEPMNLPDANFGALRAGGGLSDIRHMLMFRQYGEALESIESALIQIEQELKCDDVLCASKNEEQKKYDKQIAKDKLRELKWLKVQALLGLRRTEEALSLLDELRTVGGRYQLEADSLYKVVCK